MHRGTDNQYRDSNKSPRSKQFGTHLQPTPTRSMQKRKLSCEEIINEMEKEQDAVVMRLLREVERLKDENLQLRKLLCPGRPPLSPRHSLQSLDRDMVFAAGDDYDMGNYHYGLSDSVSATPSTRSSLSRSYSISNANRRQSPIVNQIGIQASALPIDTSMPTLSLNIKRGSTVSVTPNNSISGSSTAESENGNQLLRSSALDLDPRQKVPRRWSSISDVKNVGALRNDVHTDTARRLREYELT